MKYKVGDLLIINSDATSVVLKDDETYEYPKRGTIYFIFDKYGKRYELINQQTGSISFWFESYLDSCFDRVIV
jgi:hypothetical protein